MDYPTAKSRTEAYLKWIKIMQTIRTIDRTTIIHSKNNNQQILSNNPLPTEAELHNFVTLNNIQKARHNQETYASIVTVTTTQPIQYMKKVQNALIQQLQTEQVYVCSTKLDTTNTVEIGYFLGLHPSLTNLRWRGQQIVARLEMEGPTPLSKSTVENSQKTTAKHLA